MPLTPPNQKHLGTKPLPWPLEKTVYMVPHDAQFLQEVKKCILENLANQHFSVKQLAESIYLSISQLNRKLNKLTGQSAGKLILEIRLLYAVDLLVNHPVSISDIADQTGFRDPAYFCRRFKKQFEYPPSEFRKRFKAKTFGKRSH